VEINRHERSSDKESEKAERRRDVTQSASKPQLETAAKPDVGEDLRPEMPFEDSREWQAGRLRLLWNHRRFFLRAGALGLIASTAIAFLIPRSYTATTRLMPPDSQSNSGMAMMAALAAKGAGGLGAVAGDLLGVKSSGALFVGVLGSQTAQDRLIQQFELRKVYGERLVTDARTKLSENTSISEDRKSGIISISVTDHSPQRAAALANAYVDELNTLVSELSTSSAHRERVFLEERLKVAKQDLDDASNQLAQFSSKNNTLDIQQEGKAMLDVAANLAGQLVAGESQLEGLRQIYTDKNPRVQSLNARVAELRRELGKLSGVDSKPGENAELTAGSSVNMPYPSIHNLPLLGVKYADFYRRAKIQETVYELLTQQYELAKVQEAKETPSVKVLDPGTIPEKRSFPPRLLIMFFGTFLALAFAVAWVVGSAHWEGVGSQDPRKVFAQEVVGALKAQAHLAWQNGNGAGPRVRKLWNRISRRPPASGPADR
jgi:uncharacterized protein involved in exopolysaccharide biosynthesis